jgi:hypothetical protein
VSHLRRAARWLLTDNPWQWLFGFVAGLLLAEGHAWAVFLAMAGTTLGRAAERGCRALAELVDPPKLADPPRRMPDTWQLDVSLYGPPRLETVHVLTPAELADWRRRWEARR